MIGTAQVGNHQNEVMEKLGSWAAIILIPTLCPMFKRREWPSCAAR
ncbi:MAG: hypothetical protein HY240_00450 [Actinobacteria bacterium]|nr:hypothetical protein [Actinomycetota bacterium]